MLPDLLKTSSTPSYSQSRRSSVQSSPPWSIHSRPRSRGRGGRGDRRDKVLRRYLRLEAVTFRQCRR